MSLDSYRKTLKMQNESEPLFSNETSGMSLSKREEYGEYDSPKSKKLGIGKLILGLAIIGLLFLAALKNPSKTDAKAEIRTMIMEKVTETMRQEVTNEDNDAWQRIGTGLAMLFAPAIIDNMVQTEISDYIFFSTFDASVTVEEKRTLVAGVIVFGQVIPLKSDIPKTKAYGSTPTLV